MSDAATDPSIKTLTVNGTDHRLELPADARLLAVLRNDLGLNGPKFGCGLGECGACTVLIDGKAARSCLLPAAGLEGLEIVTLEGLNKPAGCHPLQQAFVSENATQCGYCLNGMIMTLAAFLRVEKTPTEESIKEVLRYNLCRCGSHIEVLKAARSAAHVLAEAGEG